MSIIKGFAASQFSSVPSPVKETGIGVYSSCDAPVTEINQIGITLSQTTGKTRGWLTIQLDKRNTLKLIEELTKYVSTIKDSAPAPDLKSYSWNLITNQPNY